ncbi:MAG: lipoyl(octanoyl) transferase LipB [Candidatus Melainabacteria bacterium]|nr:lipoyl(octanoyl) transferase LipB [Candidatus Melainabacteria bacterium]
MSTKNPLWVVDLGQQDYTTTWLMQKKILEAKLQGKIPNVLLLVEHPPTYTRGRQAQRDNEGAFSNNTLLIDVERGGRITWHGPGQMVAYPIIHLPQANIKKFVDILIKVSALSLKEYKIDAFCNQKSTGVWANDLHGCPKKIGFIGLAVKRWITYHGLSLNINNNLEPFKMISPCGLSSEDISSVQQCSSIDVSAEIIKNNFVKFFSEATEQESIQLTPVDIAEKQDLF